MSISRHVASATLALVLLSALSAPGNAVAYAGADAAMPLAPQHGAVIHAPSLAQNPAAQCINGYRITHQVKSEGRVTGGVILKCRS